MSDIEIFALIALPVIIAAAGFIATLWHRRRFSSYQKFDMNKGGVSAIDAQLAGVFAKFERTFLDPNRRYTAAQLQMIQTPLGAARS